MAPLYVNADWSAIVPAGSPEAAFGIDEETARQRGLLVPKEPKELEAKMTPAPANKAAKPPRSK
jgi:hypothetical protein